MTSTARPSANPPAASIPAGGSLSSPAAGPLAVLLVLFGLAAAFQSTMNAVEAVPTAALLELPTGEQAFLEDLERRSFRYFWECADPETGLVRDRSPRDGTPGKACSSIAATGFGLSGLVIAAQRGWIEAPAALARATTTLRFIHDRMVNEHGFLYHFIDSHTGVRTGNSELSSIDTALFLCGALTVRGYWPGSEAATLAQDCYHRIDWPWMTDGLATLSMGWRPEKGFLKYHWSNFSEHLGMTLLAVGSPTHPLPASVWDAWKREPMLTYEGKTFLHHPSLFIQQYPQAWFDLRGQSDAHTDYFENARLATLAQRAWCKTLKFPGCYSDDIWGITASSSAKGYAGGWGGPQAVGVADDARLDGTVVPCAPGGSLPFAPAECLTSLKAMKEKCPDAWGPYGFADAFNLGTGWIAKDVLGIDAGITLLMAENYRSGLVWRAFMANPEIPQALVLAGFHKSAASPISADLQR